MRECSLNGSKIGVVGVIHPEVLHYYNLQNPVSLLEIDIEMFV